jgi:diacylglycerol kinase (ATP)
MQNEECRTCRVLNILHLALCIQAAFFSSLLTLRRESPGRLALHMARLILNPVAGTDEGPSLVADINARLREHVGHLDITITNGPGDAERAGFRAASDGETRLFVAGGDGTLNEVLNGVYASGRLADVLFGLLPLGTGNDFAAVTGTPSDMDEAVRSFADGHTLLVDVGRLNDRVFVNASAGGFVAEASEAVTPELKTLTGRLAYLIGGAQALFSYEPVRARVEPRGESHVLHPSVRLVTGPSSAADGLVVHDLDLQLFAVCNSPLIGGGRLIAPEAVIDDGWLDVCVIETMPTLEFVALLRQVARGEHLADRRVSYFRTRDLRLEFDRVIKVNTDGQVLEAASCHYTVLPRAARFLVPRPRSTS